MRILIDITHPAYAHFFRAVVPELWRQGHRVLLTSRDKDLTVPLLDTWGFEHRCLSRAGRSCGSLVSETVIRVHRLWRVIREFRADLVLARDGAFACPAARLAGVRSISFDDTDDAPIQQALSFPTAWRVYTDRRYRRSAGRKHRHFDGVSCLAYVGPEVFRPDAAVLNRHGLASGPAPIVVRLVSWNANHDIGHHGFDRRHLGSLLERLEGGGQVLVSSEGTASSKTRMGKQPLPPTELHHVLAHSQMYVGESATMAAEAAVLGVPAIHVSTRSVWYTEALENEFGLVHNVSSAAACLDEVERLLGDPDSLGRHRRRRDAYLETSDNLIDVVMQAVAEADELAGIGTEANPTDCHLEAPEP